MKQRILKVITSLLLIITLTMANFLLLCVDVISYATDEINADKSTNHKNVEFIAYFKNENGDKVTSLDTYTNNSDLKLYFQISVKKEGYFNGNIVLNDANFEIKTDILSDVISKIENNVIYLNQINAGDSEEIEVDIELLTDEQFDLNLINMESKVSIEGIYKDSTQKDISIETEKTVTLNFVSPYTSSEDSIISSQEVITNKVLNFDGEDKRIIQIQVTSGLNNNLFPISTSTITIQTPKISDTYPEEVLVNSNDTLVTNGKTLSQDSWSYNEETGIININIENVEENNKVSWIKSGEDKLIITYIFDKDVEINNEKLGVNSKFELYDANNTVIEAFCEITLTSVDKDTIVATNITQNETSIYKGKLYAGISRDITYKNTIEINLNNVASEINIEEGKQTINQQNINSVYKTSTISKSSVESILGENGSLQIINTETGDIISTINKNTQEDESGNIVVTYPENVSTITIRLVKPEEIGKLDIETTKTINFVSKSIVRIAESINLKAYTSYISNNAENQLREIESNIILNETETSADLEINRTELSAMTTNSNVEFRITLNSKDESNELFKNPVLRLELPEKIKDIQVNSIELLYEDEMKIVTATLDNNVIEIVLEGEQTKYKGEAIDGAIIIINADLTTNQTATNSTEQVILTYTNEMAVNYKGGQNIGNVSKDIDIVSYAGVITTNEISEYGISLVNNEGVDSSELEILSDTKTVTIEKKIINNNENKISDVKILGIFPTKEAISTNNIDIEVGEVSVSGIDNSRVKIYYSDNADATEDLEDESNNWSENIVDNKNVKKYLVVIDELDLLEEVGLSYQISIPADLEYNESAEEGYTVYYTNVTTEEKVNVYNIRLATARGAVLETTLKALVAGEETDVVKEYETLRYEITVSNTGSEDMSDVKIVGNVPEGTTFVNTDSLNNEIDLDDFKFTDKDRTEVEFTINTLAQGEEKTLYYEVKVNGGMIGSEITNTITMQYGEVTKTSNEVTTQVQEGSLELELISMDAVEGVVYSGYQYRYILYVTNKSDKDLKNVKTDIDASDILDILEIYYINNDEVISEKNVNSITIDKIGSGETVQITISAMVSFFQDTTSKDVYMAANSTLNNSQYHSNEIDVLAKSNLLLSMDVSSKNTGDYVEAGDTIQYNVVIKNNGTDTANNITLSNWISNDVTLTKVIKNETELSEEDYLLTIDTDKNQKVLSLQETSLGAGESIEYQIEVIVNLLFGNTNSIELISEYSLKVDYIEVTSTNIEHILQSNGIYSSTGDSNSNSSSSNSSNNDTENATEYKIISGKAWIDENEDGQRETSEKTVEGMMVKLLNVTTNEFVKDENGDILYTVTDSTGFYSFSNVEKGQYLVIFEYDTTLYGLTTFEKNGVSSVMNSNVITKTINVDGTEERVAATEIISIDDNNISNINIGLIVSRTYDLQLNKYISKVTIQNSETVTNEYADATLVKQEIDAKQVNSTTVVVEYIIKITNNGDVAGYVKKVVDYLSNDYKFSSELNKNWYQSEDEVYCTSLANEKIEPGESKEITLTVIKEMNENNTGLINNTAEIVESYNELGLSDINSTEGNKANGENDMGSADLIISIKTGQVIMTVTLIISTIVILGVAIYIIRRMIINKRFI